MTNKHTKQWPTWSGRSTSQRDPATNPRARLNTEKTTSVGDNMQMLELSYIRWDHKMVGRYGKTVWCILKTLTELPYDVTILGTGENSKPVFTQICMEYLDRVLFIRAKKEKQHKYSSTRNG